MANRVLLGKKGSDYGLWVSKPGKDVTSASGIDLIFDSETSHGNGYLHQVIDITCSSSNPWNGTGAISGLAYIPFIHITEYDGSGVYSMKTGWGRSFGGNATCLVTGTIIKVPNGERKIEDMKVGHRIIGYDFEEQREVEARVGGVKSFLTDEYYSVNGVRITAGHPIWTEKGWACIDPKGYFEECEEYGHFPELNPVKLEVGDKLLDRTVDSIEKHEETTQVWCLEVDTTQNYFADDMLVHNGGGMGGGPSGGRSSIRWTGWRATATSSQIEIRPWLDAQNFTTNANTNYEYAIHSKATSLTWRDQGDTSGKTFRCFVYRIPATA